jgi:hypothetical protein
MLTYYVVVVSGDALIIKFSSYEWIDGSPADFFNWGYGEPNNYNDMESCITTNERDGYAHRNNTE